MKFSVFQLSRKGGRATNEDRMGYCYTSDAGLYLLADGMGGHAQGEVAAQMALQIIAARFEQEARPRLGDAHAFLREALLAAHAQILRYARVQKMDDTPGTTIVAAVIQQGQVYWAHCGDSRIYWLRSGQILQRTRDHSFSEMVRQGRIPEHDPRADNRNVLYTCLGAHHSPVVELSGPFALQAGDRLLLCSDGLWDVLPEETLVQTMRSGRLDIAVPVLVDAALQIAGPLSDNVTALAVEWLDDGMPAVPVQMGEPSGQSLFLSTIQPPWPLHGETLSDIDDAEIERAIAEINATIQRTMEGKS